MRLNSESLYFRDIIRFRVLSDEEERKLVVRVQRNEPGAYNELITANLRFVVSVARRYRGRGLGYMDLINEGNLGLIKAAKRFNLAMKVKFISYGVWWIRQSIQKALFEQTGTVRIPLNKVALFRNFKQALAKNSGDYYETIMANNFKGHENDIVEIMDKMKSISLETPISSMSQSSSGDSVKTLQDVLGDDPNQDDDTERRELGTVLDTVLGNVPSRDERIIRMYFGLNFSRLIRDKTLRKLMRNPVSRARLTPFLQDALKA
jgi:RNA polymerase primary sigma factor